MLILGQNNGKNMKKKILAFGASNYLQSINKKLAIFASEKIENVVVNGVISFK